MGEDKAQIGDSRQLSISYWLRHQKFSNHSAREQVVLMEPDSSIDSPWNKKCCAYRCIRVEAIGRGGDSIMHMQCTSTTNEAIAILKNCLQQVIITHSYVYVEVLKRFLKQEDFVAANQVRDCVIKSGMIM